MSWMRVDDEFPDHRKIMVLESDPRMWADAIALWLAVGCYVSRYGTGGVIPESRLSRMTPLGERAIEVAERLIEVGLWERVSDGLSFHDWDDFNDDHEEATEKRSAKSERQKRWREKRKAERAASTDASTGPSTKRRAPSTGASTKASSVDAYTRGRAHATRVPQPHPQGDLNRGGLTQQVADDPPPPFEDWSSRLWTGWAQHHEHHRGVTPPQDRAGIPDLVTAIATHAEREDLPVETLVDEVLEAYWADPWTRDRKNRPTLKNLRGSLARILEARVDAPDEADEDPPDWHPSRGIAPKSSRNYRAWEEWGAAGCPSDPTWQPPPLSAEAPS